MFFQDLKNIFSDSDPEFYIQRKLIRLRQAKKSFAKFYTKFSKYTIYFNFNDKILKFHLRCALSKKLFRQLVSINLKNFTYHNLVLEY